jgi:hypothetical protein
MTSWRCVLHVSLKDMRQNVALTIVQRCGTLTRMRRVSIATLVMALALTTSSPAFGAAWSWTGTFSPTNPKAGSCVWWYSDRGEACSGWNYWNVSAFRDPCPPDASTILVGFQNSSRIRGLSFSTTVCDGDFQVKPTDLGMGGYLIAQSVWWGGGSVYGTAWATG